MDPVTVAKLWMLIKPVKRIRNRRRRKRGLPPLSDQEVAMPEKVTVTLPSGETVTREEPVIPLRTSTKLGGTTSIGTIVLGMVGVFFPEALDSLTPEQALWIGGLITSVVGYITARLTKSPIVKQAL
jgi:VIT1/CCC1 family predicted Fe2+/Mn2+ transporter